MTEREATPEQLQSQLENLRQKHKRLEEHNAILLRLALAQQKAEVGFPEVLQAFNQETSNFLNVRRASVWVYNRDRSLLYCLSAYDRALSEHTSGMVLEVERFPEYFAALGEQRVVAAHEVEHDPRTHELLVPYLRQLRISSILDSPIRVGGKLRGVLCCEHVGPSRQWSEEEQKFAASVADLLSISIATYDMHRTEETMRTLLESAAQGVIAIDEQGTIAVMNSMVEEMFGYYREELVGEHCSKCLPQELVEKTQSILKAPPPRHVIQRSGTGNYYTAQRKDGSTFPLEIALSFVRQDNEYLALALVTDVTDRVESDRKLRESEELYRTVVEDQTDLLGRCTPDGTRLFVNRALCEFHNQPREELVGKSFLTKVPSAEQEKILQRIASMTPENPICMSEHRIIGGDGTVALTEWLMHGIFDEQGKLREIQAIGRDVTRQREAEARLREAQRMESLAVMASGIAHDFNNLLTPIRLYAQGLRSAFAPGTSESEHVDQILEAADRAKDLVRNILTFSRDGKRFKHQPVELAPVIRDTLKLVKSSLSSHVELQIALDLEQERVEANPTEIYQLLSNLCTNANHAMPAGGELTISASSVWLDNSELPQNNVVELIVRDTGIGISAENIDSIFDPFFSTKPTDQGTGLGLSVVHGIVTSLGGDIKVKSELGEGTTFTIHLPLVPTDASPQQEPPVNGKTNSSAYQHILVVDDDGMIRKATANLLMSMGYSADVAANLKEAQRALAEKRFFAVLLDQHLDEENGFLAINHLRRTARNGSASTAPMIIGMSGMEDEPPSTDGKLDGLLQKPFSPEELQQLLCRDHQQ